MFLSDLRFLVQWFHGSISKCLAAALVFLFGATRHFVLFSCEFKICAEVVVHRMFAVFLNGLNGKNRSRSIVRDIFSAYFFILGFKISYSEYSFVIQIVISWVRIVSYHWVTQVNGTWCTSTWPVNKQVLPFTLFVRNSSRHVYHDCSMKKQPISTAVVKMNYKIILKL